MMYCLRSYIPLLLLPLPLSLSPVHLTLLLVLTYILNRPCIYCSFLLLILFASSCHWSGRCFIDFPYEEGLGYATWFLPRLYTSTGQESMAASNISIAEYLGNATNNTISALAAAAFEDTKARFIRSPETIARKASEHAGIGTGWLRSLFGRSEWIVPCINIKLAL